MFRGIYIKLISPVVFVACCMSLLSSCSDNADGPADPRLVTLKVTLPQDEVYDMNSPASRTGSPVGGIGDESKIESVKFFIYNADNSDQFEVYATSENNSMWDDATKTLRITVAQGNKKIYCIANWADDAAKGMAAIAGNMTIASLTSKTRTHTNLVLSNPPVMAGSLSVNILGSETTPFVIPLRRQIARVELAFKLSDVLSIDNTADIKITGVKFLKLPSASYVFPQSSIACPSGTTLWPQTTFTGTTSAKLTGTKVDYATKYYIPENAPAAANATTMVIGATYNGVPTYYSIAINPRYSTNYPHTPDYVIERNHTYQYTITIEGRGADTAPATRSDVSDSTNITYKLEIK
ncbi:fimbrial protein [Bacteroides sp. 51]|uniref:fimbrial protein n=1 Tax=Bacteroides sp. 51 TaxID=2302938 RepID=UPI0013D51E34|nr:fimbrial protein [Bacteroides sp. 51]NDV84138.1 hypothetical protein [Bacteroides sp. 51]